VEAVVCSDVTGLRVMRP